MLTTMMPMTTTLSMLTSHDNGCRDDNDIDADDPDNHDNDDGDDADTNDAL